MPNDPTDQPTPVGSSRVATYRVTAPGGYWDGTDAGTYTVTLQASQVRDSSNNAAASATVASVTPSLQNVVSQAGGTVAFSGGTLSSDVIRLDSDSTFVYYNLNDTTLWYVPKTFVTRMLAAGLGASALFAAANTSPASPSPATPR
jgi:hypothetical protein